MAPSKSNTIPITVDDDDDFQVHPSQLPSKPTSLSLSQSQSQSQSGIPLKPHNPSTLKPPPKKLKKHNSITLSGKENLLPIDPEPDLGPGLDSIVLPLPFSQSEPAAIANFLPYNHSIESRLLKGQQKDEGFCGEECLEEESTNLDMLLELCGAVDDDDDDEVEMEGKFQDLVFCPLCGEDISGLSGEMRQVHTNVCLDKGQGEGSGSSKVGDMDEDKGAYECPGQVVDTSPRKDVDVSPVVEWLRKLGLGKYEEIFVQEEIDWDALQWLTEEDLCSMGVAALGPRKKIVHALKELRNESTRTVELKAGPSKVSIPKEFKQGSSSKLITDYFSGPQSERKRERVSSNGQKNERKNQTDCTAKKSKTKARVCNGKQKEVPSWCCVPGTPFRVDAFKYLRRDCSNWFLTHFHLDHYQGLTRSFCHGMIYCSSITAKLINLKIGIASDKIQVLPLNEKINIAGVGVTCFDANHCPGAVIILFEPPSGKPVLHTGDFRFCEEMAKLSILQARPIHTLILDTTYCEPQYDFPKQEAVIQFVIEAIQAEAFNPKTLFLIGSYTIGKERLFVEVARALRKKIYVNAPKLRLLECLGLEQEDMQWFTLNEMESHIHVVPMWTIASFKRLKHMSNQYMSRFSLIVAFSPTGWTFGKGKKSTGRRWQQGTIIRYEVPYSEHSSFTELREFVKLVSPVNIIPSVNNNGPESHDSMVSQLLA